MPMHLRILATGLLATLVNFTAMATIGQAIAMTPTLMPESSPIWPSASINALVPVASETDDPLGFLHGNTVTFRGYIEGGSQDQLLFAHLVYRIRLDFDAPAAIGRLSLWSAGDNNSGGDNAVFRLLDSNFDVVDARTLTGYNTLENFRIDGGGTSGTTFYVDQFDYSTQWRSLHSLSIEYAAVQSVPETPIFLLFAGGMLILACVRRRVSS